MRLYDYKCEVCGTEFEDLRPIDERGFSTCHRCGGHSIKVLSKKSTPVHTFPAGWWHHIDSKPVYVKSADDLMRICEQKSSSTNVKWPEFLDGFSQKGMPNDYIKRVEQEKREKEAKQCRIRQERWEHRISRAKELGLTS